MEKSMLKAELSKEMRTSPTVHPSDCGNSEAPINYQQLLDFKTCSDWKLLEISPHYPSVVLEKFMWIDAVRDSEVDTQ
ncbi:uncharacterized protein LOC108465481 isoform X2 [Gossypium arboreum]|uniref:uncharacterized protein LOC108465481 isoform X2 n=1 Tax=Gossypium arboreum TaxID=29729 RepID=UPI0022F165C6|nr:uncharacterized protein LOC108465481 isoform X2 [Gossypium arboreum]